MEGDRAPAPQGNAGAGGGRFGGPRWWRAGGHFSRPLLANAHFRKVFLTRTREVLERVHTPDTDLPLIDQSVVRRGPDAATRAKLRGEEETVGPRLLGRDAQLLKDHLMKRRQFLLGQQELQDGGPAAAENVMMMEALHLDPP